MTFYSFQWVDKKKNQLRNETFVIKSHEIMILISKNNIVFFRIVNRCSLAIGQMLIKKEKKNTVMPL